MPRLNEKLITKKVEKILHSEEKREIPSFKERCADVVADFGGSWTFIGLFSLFFVGWIVLNVYVLHIDDYPFILLTLILSCLAIYQAPFILMSQNRLAEIDRKREENAYKINLKAELEIKSLHAKIDGLSAQIKELKNVD